MPLKSLEIKGKSETSLEEIVQICSTKPYGFRLKYKQRMDLEEFSVLMRACPHIILDLEFVNVSETFMLDDYLKWFWKT